VRLRREPLIQADNAMRQRFQLLTSMPDIAEISVLRLLRELALLAADSSTPK
jgi:hypothetical protein